MFRIYALLSLLVLAIGCGNYPETQEKGSKNQRSKGPSANVSSAGTETSTSTTSTSTTFTSTSTSTPTTMTATAETEDSESEDDDEPKVTFSWQELELVDQANTKILNPNDVKQFIMSGDKANIYLVTTKGLFRAVTARRPAFKQVVFSHNGIALNLSDASENGFHIKPTFTGLVVVDKTGKKIFLVQAEKAVWAKDFAKNNILNKFTISSFYIAGTDADEYVVLPYQSTWSGQNYYYRKTGMDFSEELKDKKGTDLDTSITTQPVPEKHRSLTDLIKLSEEDSTRFSNTDTVKSYYKDDQDHFWVFVNGKGLFLRGQNL